MNNLEKYNLSFMDSFSIDESVLGADLLYNTIPEWDSIGHMELIAKIEEAFDILFETDDIIDLSSYKKGIELLEKYGVKC
jgi:acyl carrier protein